VIKESDAAGKLNLATAIQINGCGNLGFQGITGDLSGAHGLIAEKVVYSTAHPEIKKPRG
jgi:hypothetical protein